MPVITLPELLESGVHFGHQTRRWNPKMDPYIFTSRNGVHIIDLVQTAKLMEDAYSFVRNSAEQGPAVPLYMVPSGQAGRIGSPKKASRCGSHYVNQRWLAGNALTKLGYHQNPAPERVERSWSGKMEEMGAIDLTVVPKKEAANVLRRELREAAEVPWGGQKI